MTTIEKAARAMAANLARRQKQYGATDKSPEQWAEGRWRDFIEDARAVLAAMREPSDGMLDAAALVPADALELVWYPMIDAALGEQA